MFKFKALAALLACVLIFSACSGMTAQEALSKADNLYSAQNYSEAAKYYGEAAEGGAGVTAWRGLVNSLLGGGEKSGADYQKKLIEAYEGLYWSDGFEQEDYAALSRLYKDNAMNAPLRDLLEREYAVLPGDDILALLGEIVCDAYAEQTDIAQSVLGLRDSLAAADLDAAVKYCTADETFELLFPRLSKGHRRYILSGESDTLRLEAGFDAAGARYLNCWYVKADGAAVSVSFKGGAALTLFEGTASGDVPNGAFKVYNANSYNGSFFDEAGTLANGICTGSISSKVCSVSGAAAAEMWANRASYTYTEYSGAFSDGGLALAAQQKSAGGAVVYAYNKDNTSFLYAPSSGESETTFVFGYEKFGVPAFPVWQVSEGEAK